MPERFFDGRGVFPVLALAGLLAACTVHPYPGNAPHADHSHDPCRQPRMALLGLANGEQEADLAALRMATRALATCRLQLVAEANAPPSGQREAQFRAWLAGELAAARAAATALAGQAGRPPDPATASPATAGPATASPAAPETPAPGAACVALARVNVRPVQDLRTMPLATLKKGERVTAGPAPALPGWRAVILPDGRTGFVVAKFLAPAPPPASTSGSQPPTALADFLEEIARIESAAGIASAGR